MTGQNNTGIISVSNLFKKLDSAREKKNRDGNKASGSNILEFNPIKNKSFKSTFL